MKEYERLTERVGKGISVKETATNDNKSIWNAINRLAEIEDKIENGTLKNTIVKIGDTIYYAQYIEIKKNGVDGIRVIEPWEVEKIDIYKDYIIYRLTHSGTNDYNTARDDEFGERWFLTKAEAEQRIKELKGEV